MRRSAAGLILLFAGVMFAIAIGAFWLERVAFTPSADTDSTYAIYGDEDIRRQVANLVAGADAPELGMSPANLSTFVEQISRIRDGATEMREFTANAHATVIGDHDDPVQILAAEQVQIVRSERVALLPPIGVPVQRVSALAIAASMTSWTWLVSFGLGAVALLVGLVFRPERGEFSYAVAVSAAGTGISLVVLGYLIPAFVLPAMSGDVWVGVIPRLAGHRRNGTIVAGLIFAAIGGIVLFASGGGRQRRQHSTPLSAGRFRDTQRWTS